MKIPKHLLHSVAIGLTVGLVPSCSLHDMELDPDDCTDSCEESCEGECKNSEVGGQYPDPMNCPACGMG